MAKPKPEKDTQSAEFQAFDDGLKRALAVPKEEIDRREKEWRQKQDQKKPKKATRSPQQ